MANPYRRRFGQFERVRAFVWLGLIGFAGASLPFSTPSPTFSSTGNNESVIVITVSDAITPVTAEYIGKGIDMAADRKAAALVIELDTPGGLDTAMREIIVKMLGSDVPVIVYVSPSGARAASAGVFITLAAHVAAMAPGTNIGAAHPVSLGQGKMDEEMAAKVTNDAAAYIRSIAEKRGRNADWAEEAVRKSVSVTEKEAVKKKIVDLVAEDLTALLKAIDGREVVTATMRKTLKVADATVKREPMGVRLKFLSILTNPNVAYILMILGFYGLFFELSSPGAIFPGVFGGICLILAFYAFQALPVNYAGLMLIVLAIILFLAEIKVVSYGVLTIGGVISMILGSVMLIDAPGDVPYMRISLGVIIPTVAVTVLFFLIGVGLAIRALRERAGMDKGGLVGLEGVVKTTLDPRGLIMVHGELWSAVSEEPVAVGERVIVTDMDGLTVRVRKA
jgi:membrane-bound serine protease (ClpP class)